MGVFLSYRSCLDAGTSAFHEEMVRAMAESTEMCLQQSNNNDPMQHKFLLDIEKAKRLSMSPLKEDCRVASSSMIMPKETKAAEDTTARIKESKVSQTNDSLNDFESIDNVGLNAQNEVGELYSGGFLSGSVTYRLRSCVRHAGRSPFCGKDILNHCTTCHISNDVPHRTPLRYPATNWSTGHYTTDVRGNSTWRRYDDQKVYEITSEQALPECGSNQSYILFYELNEVKEKHPSRP